MIAYNSNEGSRHTGVVWLLWYAADSAYALGQLVAIDYSDATPDVAFTYDRLGRQLTVTDVLGTRTNEYSATFLLAEHLPDGTTLTRAYDDCDREAGISLGSDYAVGYGYDEFGRFSTVSVSNGATFTYSYVSDSSLLSGYTNDLGLAVAYEYEPHRDLKTLVSNAWDTNVISTFAYTYDAIGRRTQRIDDATTTNLFGYNPRSELTSALMGTNTYSYVYDPIGNRTSTSENGVTNVYSSNELNQYTSLNPDTTNSTPFAYDEDFISDSIQHEAKHREHFANWHDEKLPQAEADFSGTYKCKKCEEKKADLLNEWKWKWQTFWNGEGRHSNPGWEGWTLTKPRYAQEDDWWNGDLSFFWDDAFDDPLGKF